MGRKATTLPDFTGLRVFWQIVWMFLPITTTMSLPTTITSKLTTKASVPTKNPRTKTIRTIRTSRTTLRTTLRATLRATRKTTRITTMTLAMTFLWTMTLSLVSSDRLPAQETPASRLIVKYRNLRGRQKALNAASRVLYDFDLDDSSVVIEVGEVSVESNKNGTYNTTDQTNQSNQSNQSNLTNESNHTNHTNHTDSVSYAGNSDNYTATTTTTQNDNPNDKFFNIDAIVQLLLSDPDIENVQYDSLWTEQGKWELTIPHDEISSFFANQTNVRRHLAGPSTSSRRPTASRRSQNQAIMPYGIQMVQGDQLEYGPFEALVCIVDTGVAVNHVEFDQTLLHGADRVSAVDHTSLHWNIDLRGHGTHVTGTVNARADNTDYDVNAGARVGANAAGLRGMGRIPTYMTRGLNDAGKARESDVREAMDQCRTAGARVISLSLSGDTMTDLMKSVIDRLYDDHNVLIVAAAGNGGARVGNFPASYNRVVSVGAVDQDENLWSSSNTGPWIELTAPGANIVSTGIDTSFAIGGKNTALAVYSGTSMATPHVAAAAALLWSHFPNCTNTQIRYAMAYTAKDKGDVQGCDEFFGYGIVQVKAAYDFLTMYSCDDLSSQWGHIVGDGMCSAVDQLPYTWMDNTVLLQQQQTTNSPSMGPTHNTLQQQQQQQQQPKQHNTRPTMQHIKQFDITNPQHQQSRPHNSKPSVASWITTTLKKYQKNITPSRNHHHPFRK